jgi:hypothetical protein
LDVTRLRHGRLDGLKRSASPIGITRLGDTLDVMAGLVPAISIVWNAALLGSGSPGQAQG